MYSDYGKWANAKNSYAKEYKADPDTIRAYPIVGKTTMTEGDRHAFTWLEARCRKLEIKVLKEQDYKRICLNMLSWKDILLKAVPEEHLKNCFDSMTNITKDNDG